MGGRSRARASAAGGVALMGAGLFPSRRIDSSFAIAPNCTLDVGDGSPGSSVLGLSGLGGNYTVYGRIPARQNVAAGVYGDTIVVSLTF